MRYLFLIAALAFTGCVDATKFTKLQASVDSVNETLGNNTSELEVVKGDVSLMKADVSKLLEILSVDAEISVPVPQSSAIPVPPAESPPVKADAPPSEQADRHTAGPTLNGKPLDVAAVIRDHYRRSWTFPGSIETHLAEHGVQGVDGLSTDAKKRLHSALHEMGNAPAKVVVKAKSAPLPIALPQSNCPNGKCPMPQQYGYQPERQRLFGRWR